MSATINSIDHMDTTAWISVKDRLPTELGRQFVAFAYHPEWAPFKEGHESHRVAACRADTIVYDVTHRTDGTIPFASHWMPLPNEPLEEHGNG